MSWIILSLLNDREQIKSDGDIESEEFNDLVIVEKAIDSLKDSGKLSEEELELLYSPPSNGLTRNEKATINRNRATICERIAYYLGGYFTDEGYLSYMQDKYKLSDEQLDTLRKYTKSEYKFKIMRKPINE